MACDRGIILLISCYSDGEATSEEAARAIAHLEHCAECRKLLEEWREQRRMFEWTYTIEAPEETRAEWLEEPARKETRMSITEKIYRTPIWGRRSLVWMGALAATVIIGFVIHHFAAAPQFLKVGTQIAAGIQTQTVRMEGDIQLKVGPGSKISRIDDKSIRLDKGWVTASVRHGSGLRVLTRRLEVIDQGTRFEVGTRQALDYVLVEEGLVSVRKGNYRRQVNAGQALIARDQGEPSVTALPKAESGSDAGTPLGKQNSVFTPQNGEQLDWNEGLQRLAARFPDARWQPSELISEVSKTKGMRFSCTIAPVSGLRDGLREHFVDIAQAMAGERIDSENWEIPVCLIQVNGIATTPELPGDVYYVRLIPKDGAVVWRLSGSTGSQADYPLDIRTDKGHISWAMGIAQEGSTIYTPNDKVKYMKSIWLYEWPGDAKPALSLSMDLDNQAALESQKDERAMLSEVARRVPKGVDWEHGSSDLLYLDRDRKHRFLIAWNDDAGRQLCRLSDLAKQGRGGSAILGALATDVPLEEPKVGMGIYLLSFVLRSDSKTPRLELTTPDIQNVASWGAPALALRNSKPEKDEGGGSSWIPDSLPGYGTVNIHYSTKVAYSDDSSYQRTFPFLFQVTGRPDDRSTRKISRNTPTGASASVRTPTGVWAQGLIRVRKP
ncbi:MAG: zf-HC2 domain-containing protein [Armatimonadota bacterium]|nr:zf-HC2 domain-containing protein [Armatimonadota bacterium]